MRSNIAKLHPEIIKALKVSTAGPVLVCILSAVPPFAIAQQAGNPGGPDVPAFAPGMINHMQAMRRFKDPDRGAQPTPNVIPRFEADPDASGAIATFQPGGATFTANNAFFQDLGTNGRTCFTCHQPQNGWGVSAASVADRFAASAGTDPIFRLVDGATCPSANVSTFQAKRQAYKLLTDKGLIRIGLPMPTPAPPAALQFAVTAVSDPYQCTTNPATGLTNPTSGIVSVYRRPLPAANLGSLSAIMWDGREPSLTSQATTTLGMRRPMLRPTWRSRPVRHRKRHFHRAGLRQEGRIAHRWGARRARCLVAAARKVFYRRERSTGTQSHRRVVQSEHFRCIPPVAGLARA